MTNAILRGKPDAGNPHVRFDEGEVASAKPRRGSLLYSTKFRTGNHVTRDQYPKFFAMLRKAALNLGLDTKQEIEEYRLRVMREETGCASIKEMGRTTDYDAVLRRFAADAGDYAGAIDVGLMEARRKAYVVRVMAVQIMQLKGGDEAGARDYLEGIVSQARVPCGVRVDDNSFWMDVSPRSLQNLLNILDTYRRKLIKVNFPGHPVKFDDRVRYEVDGPIRVRYTSIPADYYANIPFSVNVR